MRAVLLTGGNLGDREKNLVRARELIEERTGRIERLSPVMESDAWGFEAEERFLNQVVVVDTPLEAEELLDRLQQIERELGREREKEAETGQLSAGNPVSERKRRYHSRTMDIDILFYGDRIAESARLTLPHPRMHLRRFVLDPLCEIAPGTVHPVYGKTVADLYVELKRREK